MEEISRSFLDVSLSDVEPPPLLRQRSDFHFLLQQIDWEPSGSCLVYTYFNMKHQLIHLIDCSSLFFLSGSVWAWGKSDCKFCFHSFRIRWGYFIIFWWYSKHTICCMHLRWESYQHFKGFVFLYKVGFYWTDTKRLLLHFLISC